ncbi:MAG: fructose-6-phosphate aldolase [Dehalococcoidia bacterium]|nr:fructose-6-phosphate aldolase [Dehalococcoidia bacterium]
MRLFLDTANLEHIRHGARLGAISGVTTNPSLVSKEGKVNYKKLVQEICSIIPGPVSTEVISQDVAGMVAEARVIATWAKNVVVKIPAGLEGTEATAALAGEGIKVNYTLCFSVNQALLAARAGAAYVSPFVGRLDDIGEDGISLIRDIIQIYGRYPEIKTEVIAASIRHPQHCLAAARAGSHIATVPYAVLMQMARHPLTDTGISRFAEDWKKVMGDTKNI